MKRSLDSRVDYSLLLPVFFLLVIGVVAIYIAVSHDYPNNILPILGQQVAWIALGLVIGFVVMGINKWNYPIPTVRIYEDILYPHVGSCHCPIYKET